MIENRALFLPSCPGIYLLKNISGQILYIGKAKSLRNRVKTYLKPDTDDWRIASLKREYTTIDYIVTKNEMEALLLEAQLIKEHQPKYNVLLKDGQPFLYICITKETTPQVVLVRNKKIKGLYFGPFLQKLQARSAYRYLMQTFKLTLCNKKIDGGCLKYHIDLCAGSCKKDFDVAEYVFRVQLATDALRANSKDFVARIKEKVALHNTHLEFEKAKNLHAYIDNVDAIMHALKMRFNPERHTDITKAVSSKPSTELSVGCTELQTLLQLQKPITTIDCFDISHFQSRFIVGSCVRFTNGIADKNSFRKFNIRSLQQQNDYAALQEIVTRRYKNPIDIPDLILIDGGKGQLSAVKDLVDAPCISLAKKQELLFTPLHSDGIPLDVRKPVGKLLIALRDYAHHFAITHHRTRRKNTWKDS